MPVWPSTEGRSSASAETVTGVSSASAETQYATPGSHYELAPRRRIPRVTPEVRGQPNHWPSLPRRHVGAVAPWPYHALLVHDRTGSSEGILQFVGAHSDDVLRWGRRRHWNGFKCGQSCGCCRATREGERGIDCGSCINLLHLQCCSQGLRWRVGVFSGLGDGPWHWWQWE